MTEALGGVSYAYIVSDKTGERLIVEERGDVRSKEGDMVGLNFEDRRAYFFDGTSGKRLR
jgi:lactose/L-arabinose transport system ATP-binding protein